MMDNSGNLNSPNNIVNVLDANRVPTNHVTVGRYISYLRDAFAFYEAKRYDIKGRSILLPEEDSLPKPFEVGRHY